MESEKLEEDVEVWVMQQDVEMWELVLWELEVELEALAPCALQRKKEWWKALCANVAMMMVWKVVLDVQFAQWTGSQWGLGIEHHP